MAFSDAERRQWLADRKVAAAPVHDRNSDPICGHCSNPFPAESGTVTDDFAICDTCNGV